MVELLSIVLSACLAVMGLFWRRSVTKKLAQQGGLPEKGRKKKLVLPTLLILLGAWYASGQLLTLIFGAGEAKAFHVSIFAQRMNLFGWNASSTVVATWIAMAVILLAAAAIRVFVIPRFREKPKGIQNVLEILVDSASSYTNSKAGPLGENLGAYIFSIAAMMLGCAAVELFGVRAPTADITMTFSLALITFILINYYGMKRKGAKGRIKSLASPTPLVFPMRVISDIAIPVSLACRLFGNMLGGMIVMDLLYTALGNAALGIPSVIGLYFNVFHPAIQTFIFVTLTLTFINEAAE
jgi:F-type H+-transporting ATPase subunit a